MKLRKILAELALHGIGGHVDLTLIVAEGVTTERLHTWPDVIGEKIDPFAHDEVAEPKRLIA